MCRPTFFMGLILSVAGCTPPTEPQVRAPSMSDLGRPPLPEISGKPAGATVRAHIHRIDLPITARLDAAWTLLNTTTLPREIASRWNQNGLAIGVLPPTAHKQFIAALPDHHGLRTQLLIGSGEASRLSFSPRAREPVTVHLPFAGGGSQTERLAGGQWRFLVRTLHRDDRSTMELTPYHDTSRAPELRRLLDRMRQNDSLQNRRRPTVGPQWRGRVLDELTLLAPLPPGQSLVVAAARYPDDPELAANVDDGGTPQDANEPPRHPPSPANPISGDLGRVLLTAKRAGKPIQMILIFERPSSGNVNAAPTTAATAK